VAVWNAQLKLWGVLGANDTTTDDGSATFATDINPNLLVGVALHELTHAMGRVPYGPAPDILDLFRFTSPGVHLFSGADTAPAAYFSLDGGNTKLADYGKTSDPSDFLNSGVQGPNDPFNEFYNGGTIQALSAADKAQLDALGFHTMTPVTTVIEAFGSTNLTEIGSNFYLNSISSGTGPELKYAGAAAVAGQFGGWAPIGAEQTAGGYEVAWKAAGADQYSVWNTDSNGNYISLNVYSGTSTAFESLETSFHQDLNGDAVIGVPTAVIESLGSTSLVQVGNNYFFSPGPGITGTELKISGAAVAAGQFAPYTPIGVEQTTGGYEVALQNAGTNQFSIWNTDSNGNFVSFNVYSGTSAALESLETSFQQDLNGDGVIGVPTAVIESLGSTSLVQVGSNYFFNAGLGITGTELKYAGAAVAGQFAPYTPIGVEQTTDGYEVALQNAGTNQFSIWNTDSNGNFVSFNVYSGTSTALKSLETSFHQDLNGDGVIGIPAATGTSATSPASQVVSIASNDTFVFQPSRGASDVANVHQVELHGFSPHDNHQTSLFQTVHTDQSQASFQWANGGHDSIADPLHHDSTTSTDAQLANLHGHGFII
jgi:serralysin